MLQEFWNLDMSSYLANENDFKISTIIFDGFDNTPGAFSGHIQDKIFCNGKGAMRLDSGLRFTPDVSMKLSRLPVVYPLGIRLSANVFSETDFKENPANMVITLRHQGQLYRYKPLALQELSLQKGKWNSIRLDYVIPRMYDPNDELIPFLWYSGNSATYVDDLKVEVYEQK